jgi:hypothetical protein
LPQVVDCVEVNAMVATAGTLALRP